MKRILVVLLLCFCMLAGCTSYGQETDYPAAIMVYGEIYYRSVEEFSGEVDESAILGYTESYTDTYPEKHGETNFNRELGMPYAKVDGGIVVLMNDEWYMCYPKKKQQGTENFLPETMPEDFSFSLTWGCYGISSYDSYTGKLVKTTDATHPEDYVTYYELSEEEKTQIYDYICALEPKNYPDNYDPQEGQRLSEPSMTLILSVYSNGTEKTIKAQNIAIAYESEDKNGQMFLTTCKAIQTILTETEEWKALPEYEFFYE